MRILLIVLVLILCLSVATFNQRTIKASDPYLRARIVKLSGDAGSCSGVEVRSPKGVVYTLTAGHCRALLSTDKTMVATDEEGNTHVVTLVRESMRYDLLLLTASSKNSVLIAIETSDHEKVKAITHGKGWKAFRTDGELVQEELVTFAEELITTPVELADCQARGPKTLVSEEMNPFTGEKFSLCLVQTMETLATNLILPGSSGGPLFNMKGELVGIASASSGNDPFGRFVRLVDIQEFTKDM